jgi:hypothetical protein
VKKKEGERSWGADMRDRATRERERGGVRAEPSAVSWASRACWAAVGKVGRGERKRKGAAGGLLADFSFFLSPFLFFFKLTQSYLNSNGI